MTDLLANLKQRKLVQWALAYVAAAFALIQVLDVVAQRFGWPEQAERIAILALGVGFFVALVLAWYHGERGAQRVSGTELLLLALVLLIGGGALWRFGPTRESEPADAARQAEHVAASVAVPAKSIAVLPFENLSRDPDNAYFADGMQDEILTRLAGIGDLKVISRTSTKHYASKPENLKIVAAELGVATILEGSVQKAADAVRINVQLIDAHSDTHLWAQTYDRELKNVFSVESEVAQQIVDVLKAQLSPRETNALDKPPTQNAAAYDLFLKAEYLGEKAYSRQTKEDFDAADAAFRQALALDSDFALALARKAYYQLRSHWDVKLKTPEELAEVRKEIDRALTLAPDLAEAHFALGEWYYRGFRRYDEAIEQYQRTLQLAPGYVLAQATLAYVYGRKGDIEQSVVALRKAVQLSPRDAHAMGNMGYGYLLLRRYTEAEAIELRALAINPDEIFARQELVLTRLFGRNDTAGARAVCDPACAWPNVPLLSGEGEGGGNDLVMLLDWRVYPDLFERHFDAALRTWNDAPVKNDDDRLVQSVARATIRVLAGQGQAAQADCKQFAPSIEANRKKYPESLVMLQLASWTDVCLGRNADAITAARRATELRPISLDASIGVDYLAGLAEIDAQAAAPDEAFKLIEQLLSMPAGNVMTVERLKHDPVFDPLHSDQRFAPLIARHEPAAAKP